MNKYMAFVGAWLWVSVAVADCVGGTWITANSVTNNPDICTEATCNGATFCKSSGTMNWWSAFTWCASNGLHLATFQEMCPGISSSSATTGNGACPNLQEKSSGWGWSSLGRGASTAYFVYLGSGGINIAERTREDFPYALCR